MNIYELFQKVAIQVRCKGNIGSGCLYQPNTKEYSYVLTAKHCLKGKKGREVDFQKDDIELKVSDEIEDRSQPIKVIEYLLHENLDIAIIVVEYMGHLSNYTSDYPDMNSESLVLNGYPNFMKGERKSLKCTMHECPNNKPTFEIIVTNGQLVSYGNSETELVEGFSGSGVFDIKNKSLILLGIFPGFKADEGAYHSLNIIKIEEFNKLLKNSDWLRLVPSSLTSFEHYIHPAFEARSKNISMLLSRRAEGINKVNPHMIKEMLDEKMILPYGHVNIMDSNLWISWVTLLTYLHIESGHYELPTLLMRLNKEGQKQNVKLFYSYDHKRLEDLFKIIINDSKVYNDIGSNDCIVINHEGKSGEVLRLSEKKMNNIVKDIGVGNLRFIHNIPRIDQHSVIKNISLVHVDRFTDKFKEHVEIEEFEDLEDALKTSIAEVLNNE